MDFFETVQIIEKSWVDHFDSVSSQHKVFKFQIVLKSLTFQIRNVIIPYGYPSQFSELSEGVIGNSCDFARIQIQMLDSPEMAV